MASDYWLEYPTNSNTWYYFDSNGKMVTNQWARDGFTWYYQLGDGTSALGWLKLNGVWYYLDPNYAGTMLTGGSYEIGGKLYYFKDSGALYTGWKSIESGWMYFTVNGAILNDTVTINGKSYTFYGGFLG